MCRNPERSLSCSHQRWGFWVWLTAFELCLERPPCWTGHCSVQRILAVVVVHDSFQILPFTKHFYPWSSSVWPVQHGSSHCGVYVYLELHTSNLLFLEMPVKETNDGKIWRSTVGQVSLAKTQADAPSLWAMGKSWHKFIIPCITLMVQVFYTMSHGICFEERTLLTKRRNIC